VSFLRCYGHIKVLVVGLTGGIGSGKSTVAAMLAEWGAVVIDADRLAREVVEPGQPAYDQIVMHFGHQVLAIDGTIDRAALAALVFADPARRAELEAITHPAIRIRMAEQVAAEAETDRVVILEVPLLMESGGIPAAVVIVVDCPEDTAVARLLEQRNMAENDIRRRMAAQASRKERRAGADLVIDNAGSRDELREHVARAWIWLQSLKSAKGR
jgi:dephospho-CoA kinase